MNVSPVSRRTTVPALLVGAATLALGLSYTLPTVTFRTITSKTPEVYSIWGGIVSLWRDGNVVLAPIVLLFSIVFPVAKLAALGWVLGSAARAARSGGPGAQRDLRPLVEWLRMLGKWSMLDVLIIALFVGSIRIGLATASSLVGIHVFCAAIVLSMLASATLARSLTAAGRPKEGADVVARRGPVGRWPQVQPRPGALSWAGRLVSLACVASIAVAFMQPLLLVSKLFFTNEVALCSTARSMLSSGERGLGAMLLVCAVALPALRALASCWLWWRPAGSTRLPGLARTLDEWAMLDVLALALAIVHVKLEELASTRLQPGFWAVYVAGALTVLDTWLQRRRAAQTERS